jgi:alkanesulfonate monooxygenase SsuD/methylene tetrahydromethanopterin reductase-like flavin-dependent oxidoreductase (luciferase family)
VRTWVVADAVALDVQISASRAPWPAVREATLRAEERGFGAVWVFDHLAGVALDGDRGLECFAWLGALAEATARIELGTLVANVWNRQVGTLVVAAASIREISGRPFHFGIGAGASPQSRWATEQHAVGHTVVDDMAARHARVEAVLDLTEEMWHGEPPDRLATFPRPAVAPSRIVGVNSTALGVIAGRRADGVNVAWAHPRRAELLAAARRAATGRRFTVTAWAPWSPDLLDPTHPTRREMDTAGLDRLILTVVDDVEGFLRGG